MYQTYKPSGKVSWVFFPMLLLFLLLFIPSVSFIYVYILCHSPSVIVNGILYLAALYLIALLGNRGCIRLGKLRNLKLAGLSGVLAGVSFFYMMAVCYYSYLTGAFLPEKLFYMGIRPGELLEAWKGLIETGFTVSTLKGGQLFTLRGGFLIALMAILFLLTALAFIIVFMDAVWFPFCEASKKWTVDQTIYMEYIENKDLFIKKLCFGDTSLLKQLDVLKDINCSHSEAVLYITDRKSDFYVTIVNKKKKEGETEKDGTVKYEEEDIAELLKLDYQTGKILLTKAASSPEQASARVVTQASAKHKILTLIRMAAAACIQLGLLVLCYKKVDFMQELFSSGVIWFYILITLFVHLFSLLGCFIKEDVMVKTENQLYFKETKRYQVERKDAPLWHKIYYIIMILTGLILLVLCRRTM